MKFPLVSRTIYDLAVESSNTAYDRLDEALAQCERLSAFAEKAANRYESLVMRMLEMKREGFKTTPLLTEPLKPSESALAPEIEFAIEQTATGDPFLKRHLNNWAQQQVALKSDPAAIVYGIRYGDTDDAEENTD